MHISLNIDANCSRSLLQKQQGSHKTLAQWHNESSLIKTLGPTLLVVNINSCGFFFSGNPNGKPMTSPQVTPIGLLPDVQNCWLRMRRECRERFPCHQLKRKPLVSDPGMHHGTCVTHGPWYMSGSLTRDGGKNAPGIPGACATRNFTYLVRGPWVTQESFSMSSLCGIQIDNANNNNNDNNTPIHLNNDYNFLDSSMTYISHS